MPTIHVTLPTVQPQPTGRPAACPHCGHWRLHRHGTLAKPVVDLDVRQVTVVRYRCTGCGHTVRQYPVGITAADHSQRLLAIGAILWAAGLSYAWVAWTLGLVGAGPSAPTVWRAVQALGQRLARRPPGSVRVLGVDGTGLRLGGHAAGVVVAVDMGTGRVLRLAVLDERDPAAVRAWLTPLLVQTGASVLVSDDLASYGVVARQTGVRHQRCIFHLKRWVRRALGRLRADLAAAGDGRWEPELEAVAAIVERLEPDGGAQLFALWAGMHQVVQCRAGPQPPAVRLRQLIGHLSAQWSTYRQWAVDATIPATNNRTERGIGAFKVRSRSVRGYKSVEGAVHGALVAAAVRSGLPLDLEALLAA